MKTELIKTLSRATLALGLGLSLVGVGSTAANAATDMNGVTGVIFGTGAPDYSITLQCNDLGWGFDDSIEAVAGGSFTINMDDACLNGAFGNTFYFKVLDDGQAPGDPGYRQGGVHHVGVADETPIAITGSITVDPDTIIQIRIMNGGRIISDSFTMHYVGTPEAVDDTPQESLANTGFTTDYLALLAGSMLMAGFGFTLSSLTRKTNKKH